MRMSSNRNKSKLKKNKNNNNKNNNSEKLEWLSSLNLNEIVNNSLFNPEKQQEISNNYKNHSPYPLYVINDFIDNSIALELVNELKGIDYYHKSNDLYSPTSINAFFSISPCLV